LYFSGSKIWTNQNWLEEKKRHGMNGFSGFVEQTYDQSNPSSHVDKYEKQEKLYDQVKG